MESSILKLSECPVCFDDMIPPMKIFQCINGHSLCENCKANVKIANCPSCRVPIQGDQMTRNILAESFIEAAMNKGHNDTMMKTLVKMRHLHQNLPSYWSPPVVPLLITREACLDYTESPRRRLERAAVSISRNMTHSIEGATVN